MRKHLTSKYPSLAPFKPVDFPPKRERELQGQKNIITSQTTVPIKVQKASYELAHVIAQAKKPHTIGETLIKPAAIAMRRTVHGDGN
ncbi:Uncharacterized protein FKW44_000301 [Caligus rogercresseyi]|uniref:Uncharacterized protein n=1 Tax=Caligus rogercresseyi TaxID=217165 RepID=A0A7T8KH46_CALRO|nr:Uncharacterized protein FKW44_000301 [Caligus rogercresseyi]